MAATGQVVSDDLPDQWAAVPGLLLLQFGRRQPQRPHDAGVQRAVGVMAERLGRGCEAQVMAPVAAIGAGWRFPLIGTDESSQAYIPAGLLAGFAQGGIKQAFVGLQVSGRLVQYQSAAGGLFDHQQAAIAHHHRGDGHVRLPETAFAVAQGTSRGGIRCGHSARRAAWASNDVGFIIGPCPDRPTTTTSMAPWWKPASPKWPARRCTR